MNMKRKIFLVLLVQILLIGVVYYFYRAHWVNVTMVQCPKETGIELQNPDEGIYYIHGLNIVELPLDEDISALTEKIKKEKDTTLSMIQIKLDYYRTSHILDLGMENIRKLFSALRTTGKHFIVRFLYDTDGNVAKSEPEDIDIILNHMEQLKDVLEENKDIIFTLQGMFIGNWGEMNGSRFSIDQLYTLAHTFYEISPDEVFLAVRMPSQWRWCTRYEDDIQNARNVNGLESRLGLFNDGMLFSESDYGTYGTDSKSASGYYGLWNREEELDFQEILCETVPNGGEVVGTSEYSDFENALAYFKKTHVSYLNAEYDLNTIAKWQSVTWNEEDPFRGDDGWTYIRKHLGYRYVLKEADVQYVFDRNMLYLNAEVENIGFAPAYRKNQIVFRLVSESGEITKETGISLNDLYGGNSHTDKHIQYRLDVSEMEPGNYDIYIDIRDEFGNQIRFANEEFTPELGHKIGTISDQK